MTSTKFGLEVPSVGTEVYTSGERELIAFTGPGPGLPLIGGILAGGLGVLYAGRVLGYATSGDNANKWVQYDDAVSTGAEVARGILRHDVDTGTGDTAEDKMVTILVPGGAVLYADVVSGADANAITDLGAHKDTSTNLFRL